MTRAAPLTYLDGLNAARAIALAKPTAFAFSVAAEIAEAITAHPAAPLITMRPDLEARAAQLAPPAFPGRHPLAQALADILEATSDGCHNGPEWTAARALMDLIRDAEDAARQGGAA